MKGSLRYLLGWGLCSLSWMTLDTGGAERRDQTNRSAALEALCQRLEIRAGAVVADVGCGEGLDTMVFARVVGERGTVLAQEIDTTKLQKVLETAGQQGLSQVVPVLGQSDDPRLPDGLADLIYMNRVFHHFSRPQAMLERLWHDLKPGGFLVVVDQQKGPLTDWTAMARREQEHHWTGETTVVRLAREAGFLFHDVLDDLWHERQPFVLAFRRPAGPRATGDPDLPRPPDAEWLIRSLPLAELEGAVVFCGLDQGRGVVPLLRAKLPRANRWFELILEEWALTREEVPGGIPELDTEILRTDKGDLEVPEGVQVGMVLFVDSYHRVWEPASMLQRLRERMGASGWVAIADRRGPEGESRRLASHRRRISTERVVEELGLAGFELHRPLPAPDGDRFLLLFRPNALPGSEQP